MTQWFWGGDFRETKTMSLRLSDNKKKMLLSDPS
jgi:hypothetical protein